ncbi:hypothetical protein HJ588_14220 [Flexivirga sp. ID2601S]|uniref:Uncharacterized protein n=1 Tax=Flexivirga aerilata TaxID=1656889 RepID=A0A849AM29_9MICO|nr:hypothetical protein [Flexivirga aerilata]NNG40421.1 hypothetical protein [Flexivirga aerilata]
MPSHDVCKDRTLREGSVLVAFGVVAAGVEGELAAHVAGGGVDDGDLKVLDEQNDAVAVPCPVDADVVHSAGVTQGDGSFADFVVTD